jgi:hypothetical protein
VNGAGATRRVTGGQEPQPLRHPGLDISQGQGAGVGRGQLDGQRETVGQLADPSRGGVGDRPGGQPGLNPAGPVQEQRGGLAVAVQPAEGQHRLTGHPERDPAGDQYAQSLAIPYQDGDQGGDLVADLLAVVQHQQTTGPPQPVPQPVEGAASRLVPEPAAGQHRQRQRTALPDRSELDETVQLERAAPNRLAHQPSFPTAPRADNRDQPLPPHQPLDRAELAAPTHERRRDSRHHCLPPPEIAHNPGVCSPRRPLDRHPRGLGQSWPHVGR